MPDLVTLGEAMAALSPGRIGPLRHCRHLDLSIAGSEATVAIGVRRLGHSAAWISRLGDDELGALIRSDLQAESVEVHAIADTQAPTGLMLKERRTADIRRVHYYRAGSAASRLQPADLPEGLVESAKILHAGSITPALSPSAAAAVNEAIHRASFVSFDANFRSKLWSPQDFRHWVLPVLPSIDLLFASTEEARILLAQGDDDPPALAKALRELGPRTVVLTMGAQGAVSTDPEGVHEAAAVQVTEIDPVGAGDSFVAGYLASLLDGADAATRMRSATRVAAFSVAAHGDWEGLPTAAELATATTSDINR
ncbi:2-dehydro-3-deoxygluconokinase [Catenulispora sp. MAP12-49]|uniref:sugar kinase n=1 Tax=Catenulispora sp. MAP12-49 TaxID=3156302 RepID=UPI0035189F0C